MTKKEEQIFLTNHAKILGYLAIHTKATVQQIAKETGLSIGTVQNIITNLVGGGYITKQANVH